MPISGVYNDLNSMMTVKGADSRENTTAESEKASLGRLTDSISLSSVDPKLRSVLEEISEQGGNMLETLENNVENLQEGFLQTLSSQLHRRGVDLQEKLTLRLTNEKLAIQGFHPDGDRVLATLEENPELESAFKEIATQSGLARDIRNIRSVVSSTSSVAQYAHVAEQSDSNNHYQMSMRGAMSHFYFSSET